MATFLGKICPSGWPCVFIAFFLCNFVFSPLGFEGGFWFLIDPVPAHCSLATFTPADLISLLVL